jgi:hypothetical protein
MTDRATLGTRLGNGAFLNMTLPERASVRHGWADQIEVGSRAYVHDAQTHPFTNWGYANSLVHTLAQVSR